MRLKGRWLSPLISGLLVTLIGLAWVVAAPAQFGGQLSYVIVVGSSMEPALRAGDLAIVRQEREYGVGDVVAYRHPNIGAVIHRVSSHDGERFVFKGDKNTWVDSHEPIESELIGKLWVQIPYVGALMDGVRSSWILPIAGGLLGAITMAALLKPGDANKLRRRVRRVKQEIPANALSESAQGALTAIGAAFFAFLLLTVVSFAQPTHRNATADAKYEQTGVFSYTAPLPEGSVYDAESVATGEPIFRRLASEAAVSFAYRFASQNPHDVSGTHRLTAILSDNTGWKRTIELQPQTPFVGDTFSMHGVLDLRHTQSLIDQLEALTGVNRDHYNVAIVPEVATTGMLAGQELSVAFSPRLSFRLDPLQLQLLPPGPREADPRSPVQSGAVQVPRIEPNTLSILMLKPEVANARWLALIGLTLSLAGAAAVALLAFRALAADEPSRIRSRFGPLLVSVHAAGDPTATRVVDVATIDDLARLAERNGRMILHETHGRAHQYLVQDGETTYRYQVFRRRGAVVNTAVEAAR